MGVLALFALALGLASAADLSSACSFAPSITHGKALACTSAHASNETGGLILGVLHGTDSGARGGHFQVDVNEFLKVKVVPTPNAEHGTDRVDSVPGLGKEDHHEADSDIHLWKVMCKSSSMGKSTHGGCVVSGPGGNYGYVWPGNYDLTDKRPTPTSWYSSSLGLLFVLFPIGDQHTLANGKRQWTGYTGMTMQGILAKKGMPTYTHDSDLPELNATLLQGNPYHSDNMGIELTPLKHGAQPLVWDKLQVVGLPATPLTRDHVPKWRDVDAECCSPDGTEAFRCTDIVFFHYGVPCTPTSGLHTAPDDVKAPEKWYHQNSEGCFVEETGEDAHKRYPLAPLPNFYAPGTVVDARYSPAMVFSCSADVPDGEFAPVVTLSWTNVHAQGLCHPLADPSHCKIVPTNAISRKMTISYADFPKAAAESALEAEHGMPWWAILLLVLGVGVVITLLVLLICKGAKKKQDYTVVE